MMALRMIVTSSGRRRSFAAFAAFATSATLATAAVAAASGPRTNAAVGGPSPSTGLLATGQYITALVSPGASYQPLRTFLRPDGNADGNGALSTALSPDGKTLLVLTSGYNTGFKTTSGVDIQFPYIDPHTGSISAARTGSFQWIFIYDVSSGVPLERQELPLPSSFAGLAWDPSGSRFFASGGQDDRVYVYSFSHGKWGPDLPFAVLNHNSNDSAPKPTYDGGIFKSTPAGRSVIGRRYGLDFGALTAGVTVSADGKQIYVANMENDSVSVVDAASRKVVWDLKLFDPGSTVPKGEYPYWISAHAAANGATDKLFVSSIRDGQVLSIAKSGRQNVIDLGGEPGKMLLSRDGARLYVANPDLDEVDEIDTGSERLMRRMSVLRPGYRYHGSNPNSLALTSNGGTLYVTLGGENAVAVIDLSSGSLLGRIPTCWYPTAVTLSSDDSRLFIVNRKANTGPDLNGGFGTPPPYGVNSDTNFKNEYIEALEKAGILTVPVPDSQTLAYLSAVVDANNNYSAGAVRPSRMMQYLHQKIKHVIYIMKENRTYDQMLGDLPVGNGEPRLVMYPQPVTPNFHALALRFADLDNFYAPSQSSGDGWEWTWQGHVNDFSELTESYYFGGQGPSGAMDFAPFFGSPRLVNLALPLRSAQPGQYTQRITTNLDATGASTVLPGTKDLVSSVGADDDRPGQTGGYIWDTVLRAGLTVRHYGIWDDQFFYYNYNGVAFGTPGLNAPGLIPIVRDAAAKHVIQGVPTHPALVGRTDPYFRGWDLNEPDEYRYEEWKREFDQFVGNGKLPNLEIMTLMMDHTGGYATNVAHLTTPTADEADNDHAVGLLVDAVSHSPYWKDTAIFIVEDDSVDGPDHVDAHRSPAYVISPWVATNAVVHTFYNTDSVVRTIEDLLGVNYLGSNDATAASMDDVFSTQPNLQPYNVTIPGILCAPPVDPKLVPDCYNPAVKKTRRVASLHDGHWWAQQTKNLVFDRPDANDPMAYSRLVWRGIMGDNVPYPTETQM